MPLLWIVTALGACAGGLLFVVAIVEATGAPQQAAGAAMALCLAVIPYVFTRAVEAIITSAWRQKMLDNTERDARDFREGVKSLWEQLDRIRVNTAQSAGIPAQPANYLGQAGPPIVPDR